MAFINPADKLQVWKYKVEEFTLIFPTSTYDVPIERVLSLSIDNDYEKHLFPIIRISMGLEPSVYKEIITNKSDVKLKIRFQKFYTELGKENKSLMRDYFNTTFDLLIDDEFLDQDYNVRKTEESVTGESADDKNDLRMIEKTEFYLYKMNTINGLRTMVNAVLNNVTMIGAISYLGSIAKITNFLTSPLENNTVYRELIIPPQTALSALQYLDSEYGFYKSGSTIFFGLDRSYILNYKGGCTAYQKDEIQETCILIPERGEEYGALELGLEKLNEKIKRNYIVVRSEHVFPNSENVSRDIIDGTNVVIVNTNQNTITKTNTNAGKSSSVINTNATNPWIGETYSAQVAASSKVLTLSCGDFDVDAITPNKKFSIIFEDTINGQNYKGIYILSKSILRFTRNGSDFELNASLTFKRVNTATDITIESL